MRVSLNHARGNRGFTLLEVLIAAVVMAVVFMGLMSSISGTFMATNMANRASWAQATARRMLEEATELDYSALLLIDGNALVTSDGLAARFEVYEASAGLIFVQVDVCQPKTPLTQAQVAALTQAQFDALPVVNGSRVRFSTLTTALLGNTLSSQGVLGASGQGSSGSGSATNWFW